MNDDSSRLCTVCLHLQSWELTHNNIITSMVGVCVVVQCQVVVTMYLIVARDPARYSVYR